jgi:hypothetical protein
LSERNQAIENFLTDKPKKMLMLPDGGEFLMANLPTASFACLM